MNQAQQTPTEWRVAPHPLYPGMFCAWRKVGDRREHLPSAITPSAMAMFHSREAAAQAVAQAAS